MGLTNPSEKKPAKMLPHQEEEAKLIGNNDSTIGNNDSTM